MEEVNNSNVSIKDTLAKISENLETLKEQKKNKTRVWNLPWSARTGMGKSKKRKGYVVFMNIGLNRAVTFIKAPVEEGVAMVNGVPHVVNSDDILIWKNKIPIVIQPQFSEKPFSAQAFHNLVTQNKEETKGWQYIMNYILKHQIKEKKEIPVKALVIGAIVLIGLGWYLMKSGALK